MTKSTFIGVRIAEAKKVIQDFLESGDFIASPQESDQIKFAKYKLASDTYVILDDDYEDDDSLENTDGAWVAQLFMPTDGYIERNIDFYVNCDSLTNHLIDPEYRSSHAIRKYIRDMSNVDELIALYKSNIAILAKIYEKVEQFRLVNQIKNL